MKAVRTGEARLFLFKVKASVPWTVPRAEISTPERPAHLPSPVSANERGPFVPFLPCLRQKSAPQRGPLICPQWSGSVPCHGQERPAHLPSPARANERGLFLPFSRAEISTLERPAHLRANEPGPFVPFLPCHGQKPARRRGPLVSRRGQMSGVRLFSFYRASAHLLSLVRANQRGPFVPFFTVPRAEISTPERPAHLLES